MRWIDRPEELGLEVATTPVVVAGKLQSDQVGGGITLLVLGDVSLAFVERYKIS